MRDGNQADPPARVYGYHPLNRLTEAKDASDVVWQSYSYDKTGNRQNAGWRDVVPQEDCTGAPPGGPCTPLPPTTQWSTEGYTYHPGTHRLFTRTGRERSYDSAGNLTLDAPMGTAPVDPPPGGGGTESAAYEGTMQAMSEEEGGEEPPPPGAVSRTYSYNVANRMSGTSLGGEHLMSYRYNGRGERVYRQGADRTVHTVFDDAGRWIGDYDANGAVIQQAIWLGDLPVGLLAKDGGVTRLFHIEADALGSPRVVIDPTRGTNGTVVWRWDLAGEAFGNDKPNEDPDGDDVAFVLDMRYPGQQYDSASELNYNYFRDYEAKTGRYVQSDPIGLDGGISTFGYVGGSPLVFVDYYGLAATLNMLAPDSNPRDNKADDGACGKPCGHEYAKRYKNKLGEFSVAAHGDNKGVWDERLGYYNRQHLNAAELAQAIKNHSAYSPGMTVRLLSCRSAEGGADSLAALVQAILASSALIGSGTRVQGSPQGSFTPFNDTNGNRRRDPGEPAAPWVSFPGGKP